MTIKDPTVGRTSTTIPLQRNDPPPPDKTNLPTGLGAINNVAPPPNNTPPQGGNSALAPNGTQNLANITAKTELSKLSEKSGAIYAKLQDDLSNKLESRLSSAPKSERKEMEKLLHFSYSEAKTTTREQRLEVRFAVATYLAEGGGLEGAKLLREVFTQMPDKGRKSQLDELMNTQGGSPSERVGDAILKLRNSKVQNERFGTTASPQEHFAKYNKAVTDFPADPSKAKSLAFSNDFLNVGYDNAGKLEIRSTCIQFQGVHQVGNVLDQSQVTNIETLVKDIAKNQYSTLGVPLDFITQFQDENERRTNTGEQRLGMREAFESYKPDGAKITDEFGGSGDCMCHAEKLVAELKKSGIEAKIVGHYTEGLIKMTDPSDVKNGLVTIPGQLEHTERVTHLDVMIPYTTPSGEERVIVVSPGIGPNDEKTFADMSVKDMLDDPEYMYKIVENGTNEVDPAKVQKAQIEGRHNLKLLLTPVDGPDNQRQQLGLDMLAGKLYLNRLASDTYRAAHGDLAPGQDRGAISLDFKALLDDPDAPATLRTWDPVQNAYVDVQTDRFEAFVATLEAIRDTFGQPDRFVDDIINMVINFEEYREEMIAKPLVALSDAFQDRTSAIANKPGQDSPNLQAWEQHFSAAAERLTANDPETAIKHYKVAASL